MNYPLGLTAAAATVGCWTVGTLSFTAATRLAEPKAINRVRLLYATCLLIFVSAIVMGITPARLIFSPSREQWLWLGLSGIIGLTIGDFFAFSAYQTIGSGRGSLFTTIAPVAALFSGIFLLDEHINFIGIIGMSISISGILWFIRSSRQAETDHANRSHIARGMLHAILGAICQGVGLVCAKKGLAGYSVEPISPVHATWMRMAIATLTTYVIGIFRTDLVAEFKRITFNKSVVKPVLLGTLFGPVIGVSMSLLAATNMEASLAQTVFSLLPVSVMLTAFITGRERMHFRALIAALISICGIVILVWRNELMH